MADSSQQPLMVTKTQEPQTTAQTEQTSKAIEPIRPLMVVENGKSRPLRENDDTFIKPINENAIPTADGGIYLRNRKATLYFSKTFTEKERAKMLEQLSDSNTEDSSHPDYEFKRVPRHPIPQRDATNGRFIPGPANAVPPLLEPELTQKALMSRILDWVETGVLYWDLPNGVIPVAPIWFSWTSDERLLSWTDLALEIDCANFSGNTSEMSFTFPFDDLKREYQPSRGKRATKAFKVPSRRFAEAPKFLFSLTGLPHTCQVSYLLGYIYQRELSDQQYQESYRSDPLERRPRTAKCLLVLKEAERAPHALVKITDHTTELERRLANLKNQPLTLLKRPDVMDYHSVTLRRENKSVTDLYLELDLKEAEKCGYLSRTRLKAHADKAF